LERPGADPEVLALASSAALLQTRKPDGGDLPLPGEGVGVVFGNPQDFGYLGVVREKIETDTHETLEAAKIALVQYGRMLARELPQPGPTTPLFSLPAGTNVLAMIGPGSPVKSLAAPPVIEIEAQGYTSPSLRSRVESLEPAAPLPEAEEWKPEPLHLVPYPEPPNGEFPSQPAVKPLGPHAPSGFDSDE